MQGVRARSALAETRFADLRWVHETGSTNVDLVALAADGAPEGVVLVADHQTEGRGRLDRSWVAPPSSSLLVSVLLRPDVAPDRSWLVAAAAGLAVTEACRSVLDATGSAGAAAGSPAGSTAFGLKWPNDVVALDHEGAVVGKVAGSLAEAVVRGGALDAVVLGFGLNVNWPDELPPELRGVAVALNHIRGGDLDRESLLISVLLRLEHWLREVDAGRPGCERLLDGVRQASTTIGRRIRIELADATFEGVAVDVDGDGELLVQVDGERTPRVVRVGDVVHLRPHG